MKIATTPTKGVNIMANQTLTTKEAAEKVGTDPKTLRKFLRFEAKQEGGEIGEATPGKGGRYALEAKQVNQLKKRFAAWDEARRAPAAETEEEVAAEVEETEEG